jgi:hypothetical protein
MARFVKLKLGAVGVSLFILAFIPLYRTKFYAPPSKTRWKELTWADFQGWSRPFTAWGASIASEIYLEYDSLQQQWSAYASMNQVASWVRSDGKDSDKLLTHEQYHFNITEVHARMMNNYIVNNPEKSKEDYLEKFYELRQDLDRMQDEYDTQGDHSLIRHLQHRWEYKIDSMLQKYNGDLGLTADFYSGAKVYFPTPPKYYDGINDDGTAYRIFQVDQYGVSIAVSSFQMTEGVGQIDIDLLKTNYYNKDSLIIRRHKTDTVQNYPAYRIVAYDSASNQTRHHLWIQNEDYRFKLTVDHYGDTVNVAGYYAIADSFFDSFDLFDPSSYWFEQATYRKETKIWSGKAETTDPSDQTTSCFTFTNSSKHGFLRAPMFREDGSFLIAYEVLEHPDSLIESMVIIADEEVFSYKNSGTEYLFDIPRRSLHTKPLDLYVGYLLKKDSSSRCEPYYYEWQSVQKPKQSSLSTTSVD